ncbi:MAG TPA: MFS transporter [Clostridiaceae bacterium]|nr:MFS transporter [Clostridiaceae bacterium]
MKVSQNTNLENTNLNEKIAVNRQRFFYGWIVAGACFIMVFVGLGLGNSPSGLYITPVTKEMGFSRGAFSVVFTFRFLFTAAFNFLIGFFVRKLEVRKMVGIGYGLLTTAFFIFSRAQSLAVFYICGALYGAGSAFCTTAVVSIIVERWFVERKGTIMGVILAGSGLGGSLFSMIVADWIQNFGWRQSYFFTSVCYMICSIPLILAIRNYPADMGLLPFGSGKEQPDNMKRTGWEGFTLDESLRKPYFYLTAICVFFTGFLNSPVYALAPSHMIDRGLDPKFAAFATSVFFFSLAIAKVVLGIIFDRFGLKITLIVCFCSHICGILILALVQNKVMAILYAVIFGFSVSMETVTIPLMVLELFGSRTYRAVIGNFLAMSTIGISLGNPTVNFSYDLTGSYQGILLIYVILSTVILALLLYIMRCSQRDKKDYFITR